MVRLKNKEKLVEAASERFDKSNRFDEDWRKDGKLFFNETTEENLDEFMSGSYLYLWMYQLILSWIRIKKGEKNSFYQKDILRLLMHDESCAFGKY